MSKRPMLSILALSFLVAVLPAAAQPDQPEAGFSDLVEVKEVLLDVLATDSSGQIAAGLGKDDFVVEENGQPVEVTGVSFYTTRYADQLDISVADLAAVSEEPAQEVPSSRYFIFLFHDQSRLDATNTFLLRQQLEAGRESRQWAEEHMLPSDWVAVASYDVKLKIHQDFTQDRYAIVNAIDRALTRKDPEKGLGRRGRELPPLGAPSLLRHLPQGKKLRNQTTRIYDGVRLVAEAAGHIVGRKNLMLFSNGFGEFRGSSPIPFPDNRFYPAMEQALNDHNIAVYPIDLVPRNAVHLQAHFLSTLASDTGGRYIQNFVNYLTPLKEISKENSGYYLLSYQSEHPASEAGFQKVKVRAKDGAFKVRARKGYRYGTQDET